MNLRERLLAHLREPGYKPANEFELAGRLGLNKKQRAMLAHEVRLVLKSGQFNRGSNGRITARAGGRTNEDTTGSEARPIFQPTRRGAAMPPPTAPAAEIFTPGARRDGSAPAPRARRWLSKTSASRVPSGSSPPTATSCFPTNSPEGKDCPFPVVAG